jgi:DNA-binding winged helix-turn-helix (wHTH) protein/Tol biopolymer transport system component
VSNPGQVKFGVFELDLTSGELRKGGTRIRLQDQPFQVLKALVEKPGEVVTREELQQRLWPRDTFVDFEDGLSTAVKKIRRALGDSAANPRFVETLPKRGYRFVVPVAVLPVEGPEVPGPPWHRRWWVSGCLAAVVVVAAILAMRSGEAEAPVVKFVMAPGLDVHDPVISPDGRQVAFVTFEGEGGLWIRGLSEAGPRQIPGSEGARRPFWSPDSHAVVFGAGNSLHRVDITGDNRPFEICAIPGGRFRGGTWSPEEDVIYFANLARIARVSPAGGEAEFVESAPTHRFGEDPIWLPVPGRRIVMLHREDHHDGPEGLWVLDLDRGTKHRVASGLSPVYSPTGHILYQEDGRIPRVRAARFSLKSLAMEGEPFVVAENASAPSLSADGNLVYLSGAAGSSKRVVWRDRSGGLLEVASGPLQTPSYLDLSPGEDAVVMTSLVDGDREIFILDLENRYAGPRRLTFNSWREGVTMWSPEGRRIAYRFRDGPQTESRLVIQPRSGGSLRELPVDGIPTDWWGNETQEYLLFSLSHDGLGYGHAQAGGEFEYGRFVKEGAWCAQLSPDGRFVAYLSAYPTAKIMVRSFPDGDGPWPISRPGERAVAPRWSPEGDEIYYAVGDQLVAASVTTRPEFAVASRTNLFRSECFLASVAAHYDVAAGGDRFVLLETVEEDPPALWMTQNWFAEFAGLRD